MGTVDSSGSLADLRTRFDLFGGADELPPSLRQRTANTPQLTAMARSPSSSSSSPSASASDSDEPETRATTPGVDDPLDKSSLRLPGEHWAPRTVHPAQDHTDFLWQMNEEPHRSRRMAIMKAHPEVRRPGGGAVSSHLAFAALTSSDPPSARTRANKNRSPSSWATNP